MTFDSAQLPDLWLYDSTELSAEISRSTKNMFTLRLSSQSISYTRLEDGAAQDDVAITCGRYQDFPALDRADVSKSCLVDARLYGENSVAVTLCTYMYLRGALYDGDTISPAGVYPESRIPVTNKNK